MYVLYETYTEHLILRLANSGIKKHIWVNFRNSALSYNSDSTTLKNILKTHFVVLMRFNNKPRKENSKLTNFNHQKNI